MQNINRILAPPEVTKGDVVTKLCTADGLVFASAPRRATEI